MLCELFIGCNKEGGVLEYCDWGHEPPFLIRGGGKPQPIEKLGGMALGVDASYPYQSATVQLNQADTLFLYTDGVKRSHECRWQAVQDERH